MNGAIPASATPGFPTSTTRTAVYAVFALNGFCFASWVSRIPDTRTWLDLTNAQLGLLLLALSLGSLVAMPMTGVLIDRVGAARVVLLGSLVDAVGLFVVALGVGVVEQTSVAAVGLFLFGMGTGTWDVAMNVEGAVVEHASGRTLMPRFHASFSLGTVAGAALGAVAAWWQVALPLHLGVIVLASVVGVHVSVRHFVEPEPSPGGKSPTDVPVRSAWTEPRTLLIGLMVLALALTEGAANDWLAVALVDGYDVEHWAGVAGFAIFVATMTLGRLCGTWVIDRFGRLFVLWSTMLTAAVGLMLIVFGGHLVIAVCGIVLWGLGASLGFPVGMSAAADDPRRAAARVSVVSTIGYTAFLAGPPVLGFLAEEFGTLRALLAIVVVLVPSALVVPAAAPSRPNRDSP